MKNSTWAVIIIIINLLVFGIVYSQNRINHSEQKAEYYCELASDDILCDTELYATKNGKKYHVSDCKYLKSIAFEFMGEREAQEEGYTACKCIKAEKKRIAAMITGYYEVEG